MYSATVDAMEHPVARMMLTRDYSNLGNGSLVIPEDECFCMEWLESRGSRLLYRVSNALQWFAFGLSLLSVIYYAYATWKLTCGWEEVYVALVEMLKVIFEFFHEFDMPAMLYLANGQRVFWCRYGEWLLSCPVLLIHLSNLTGLTDDYNIRTMKLLLSDIGTIVWGATAAMSTGYVRLAFFLIGCVYGANTFYYAAKVYIESYYTVPEGVCRKTVKIMAWVFFVSWSMFPILFLLGPEGFGPMSAYGSTIGHTVTDIVAKNIWGLLGHYLRLKIYQHILLHGEIRKLTKIKVMGQEVEVEALVAEEDSTTIRRGSGPFELRPNIVKPRAVASIDGCQSSSGGQSQCRTAWT